MRGSQRNEKDDTHCNQCCGTHRDEPASGNSPRRCAPDSIQLALEISLHEWINGPECRNLSSAHAAIRNVLLSPFLVFLAQCAAKQGLQILFNPLTVNVHSIYFCLFFFCKRSFSRLRA